MRADLSPTAPSTPRRPARAHLERRGRHRRPAIRRRL